MNSFLPVIFDTKAIANSIRRTIRDEDPENKKMLENLKDSNLFVLYFTMHKMDGYQEVPGIEGRNGSLTYLPDLKTGLERNLNKVHHDEVQHCHEAGFDAYVTGVIFLRLVTVVKRHRGRKVRGKTGLYLTFGDSLCVLENWKNQINISRAVVTHIVLSDIYHDPKPFRPPWIRAKVNPKNESKVHFQSLNTNLTRFGDVELRYVGSDSVLIAVGGIKSAQELWKYLEDIGYNLTVQEFPKSQIRPTNYLRWGVAGIGAAGFLFWCWRNNFRLVGLTENIRT